MFAPKSHTPAFQYQKKYYYDGDVWNKASRTSPPKIVTMTGLVQKLKIDANFYIPVT